MYTKRDLIVNLENNGFKKNDTVMIHSSMKSIGDVEGGAETVVDALMEYFCDGLLMMPTHTWAQMSAEYSVFDPQNEPGCVGIIPNIFMKRKGVMRSLHPTHSIAVIGQGADEYIKGEENCTTPCTPGGCWDRLRKVNAKIMMIGVNHIKNTFIHSIEEVYDVPERFTKEPVNFKIKMPDGNIKNVQMYRHFNPQTAHISESYDKLTDALYGTNAAYKGRFGDADCIICDAVRTFDIVGKILTKEINCLIDRENIPKEWWK